MMMKKHTTPKRNRPTARRTKARPKPLVMGTLIQQTTPAFDSFFIEEPKLVFSQAGLSVDPKEGIERFGPYEADRGGQRVIRVGIVGTGVGIQTFTAFLERCRGRVVAGFKKDKPYDVLCFPDFPGCTDALSFRCSFVTDASIQRIIPDQYFEHAVAAGDASAKLKGVVELVTKEMAALAELESTPDVVVFVMPKVVEKECGTVGEAFRGVKLKLTPGEKLERKLQKEMAEKGQSFLKIDFDVAEEDSLGVGVRLGDLVSAVEAVPEEFWALQTTKIIGLVDGGHNQFVTLVRRQSRLSQPSWFWLRFNG
jgi:hypothetical protein